MKRFEKFFCENMVGTDMLCVIADHERKILSCEQHDTSSNMVAWTLTNLCSHLGDYQRVWRNLDFFTQDNNIL